MRVQLEHAHDLSEYIIKSFEEEDSINSLLEYANRGHLQKRLSSRTFAYDLGKFVVEVEENPYFLKEETFSETPHLPTVLTLSSKCVRQAINTKRSILMSAFCFVKIDDIIKTDGKSINTAEMFCEVLTLVIRGDYAKCTDGIFVDTPELRAFIDKVFMRLCEMQHFQLAAEVLYAYKKLSS